MRLSSSILLILISYPRNITTVLPQYHPLLFIHIPVYFNDFSFFIKTFIKNVTAVIFSISKVLLQNLMHMYAINKIKKKPHAVQIYLNHQEFRGYNSKNGYWLAGQNLVSKHAIYVLMHCTNI